MPTEVPFISETQLPNQSASLDILGMEEIGENGGQNISEEYGLTLESDWSLQPDLFEDPKDSIHHQHPSSTINNISITSETEEFSALINNPEDRTYLGRTLAKEYLGIKEEFYQAYHQFSPPPKHPTLNISGQNKQL
ncbi:hypothetical protein H4Q26_009479 [Puccinia striiformis f. sp. tritici PST-130]|nr:hypothetical protein H4Q26_009479 [Puccinia striiformis f. sp. tritici PST-130]